MSTRKKDSVNEKLLPRTMGDVVRAQSETTGAGGIRIYQRE
jgi:hypothetical protein